jgi:predicted site-specific integrase-resolvase
MSSRVTQVVVSHRDRLARFGFDLSEWLLCKVNPEIMAVYSEDVDPDERFAENIIFAVVPVFAARVHGLRSYKRALTAELDGGETESTGKPGGIGAQTKET